MTRSDGTSTLYSYCNDNRLHQVTFRAPGQADGAFTYTYDLAGRPETITFPTSTGIVLHFKTAGGAAGSGWDANGRLISMRYIKGGSTIQSFDYSYDNSGNRIGMVDISAAGTFTWAYGYDWLDRLISVSLNGTTTALYEYDNSDNRTKVTRGTDVYTSQVDSADQLQNVKLGGSLFESFQHNADGCMVSRTLASTSDTTAYDWNDFNNLIGFALNGDKQEADYYETDGVRRLRSDGTRYTSSGGVSLADMRPSPVGPVSYIQGHLLLGLQEGGNVFFHLHDGIGSVRQVVDTSGATVATFATDEYGVPDPAGVSGSAELLAHTYVGGLGVRNETGVPSGVAARGLYYMRQRWYDATLGQFISSDPIGFASGSLNNYGYVGGDPINHVDPSGLLGGSLPGYAGWNTGDSGGSPPGYSGWNTGDSGGSPTGYAGWNTGDSFEPYQVAQDDSITQGMAQAIATNDPLVIEGFLNEATGSVLSQGQREILKLAIKRLNSTAAQEASRICNGATARRIPGELQNMLVKDILQNPNASKKTYEVYKYLTQPRFWKVKGLWGFVDTSFEVLGSVTEGIGI